MKYFALSAVALMFLIGCGSSTAETVDDAAPAANNSSPAEPAAPTGDLANAESAGFNVTFPDEWTTVEIENATDEQLAELRKNPSLAVALDNMKNAPNGAAKLVYAGVDPDNQGKFAYNFYCLAFDMGEEVAHEAFAGGIADGLKAKPENKVVSVDDMEINGHKFTKVVFEQGNDQVQARAWNYLAVNKEGAFMFSFLADKEADGHYAPMVEEMMNSVQF